MRRFAILAAGILAASPVAGQTADELIAKYIAARGGLENLRAVQTMRLTGTMKAGTDSLPSILELKRPNKSRWEFTLEGQTAVEAFDGKGGWTWIPFAGQTEPQPMSDEDSADAELQADIDGPLVDYQKKGSKVELLGHDPAFHPEDWKLKVTLKSGEVRYVYLDPKTYLQTVSVLRRKVDGNDVEVRSEVSDYRKVGAVLLPHAFKASTSDGSQSQTLQFERIDLNVPIDDDRFRMPIPKKPADGAEETPNPVGA
jgi:outer membrane lipoprotein-sorting protein